MKKRNSAADALTGLVLMLLTAGAYLLPLPFLTTFLESLEMKAYDMRSSLRQSIDAGGKEIVLIPIDDDSIARLGRWPWPRTRLAEMLDLLASAHPKVIGLDVLLSEPEQNTGLQAVSDLKAKYDELVKRRRIIERQGAGFSLEFDSAAVRLDADSRLKASLTAAGNVVLPMAFDIGGISGAKPDPLPPAISSQPLTVQILPAGMPEENTSLEGDRATPPIPAFAEASMGVGFDNVLPDFDGVVRRMYPAIKYGRAFYPSYSLQLVLHYLGYQPRDGVLTQGRAVTLGKTRIPVGDDQSILITYPGPTQSFRYYPFHEVLSGKITPDVFKDKIVIIGASAMGVATLYVTPLAHNMPGIEVVASAIEDILHQQFLVQPAWAWKVELGSILIIGLFIMFLLPRLRALGGAGAAFILLTAILAAGSYLFVEGQWVKVVHPAFLLVAGYVIITTKRFLVTERGKELVEASAIETNKMLGLSFQGQGMLDLAFDKFRLCPVDVQLKDLLYNLGLDFERKRQYNKAVAVYEHIAASEPKFKDIQEKIKMLGAAAQGAVFGGVGSVAKEGTVLISDGASKPTLGRYEIEKELGRGAMGIVYLGKDPKINRQVAIKTMMLEEGTDPKAVKETKERFFREAESAGKLNHPNIVRIFDAGEEHDVCYIAMELLEGHDLTGYTSKGRLLPIAVAMEYIAKVAGALDYAHAQGVVHRDIKPANIMILKDGSIRVTDFGIARITASSKTATGTVMGTPSYMSPEQVAGKKVDGRSDLFSLGATLFELLTGEKPFKGGEGIGTLLFQIANDPEPDPTAINPQIPSCAAQIIHYALNKNPDDRYQTGAQIATDIQGCIQVMQGAEPEVQAGYGQPSVEVTATKPETRMDGIPAPVVPAVVPEKTLSTAEEIAASIIIPPETNGSTQPVPIDMNPKSEDTIKLSPEDMTQETDKRA